MVEKYGPQVYGEEFEAKRILKNGMFDGVSIVMN